MGGVEFKFFLMDFPLPRYELILQPASPGAFNTPQWVLTDGHSDIASWTMKHRPSLIAVLKAIKLFQAWDNWDWDVDCVGAYRSRPPFKTYFPS